MSDKRKRLSGFQYRKLKTKKLEAVKQNTSDITQFLKKNAQDMPSTSTCSSQDSVCDDDHQIKNLEVKLGNPTENSSLEIKVGVDTSADSIESDDKLFNVLIDPDPSAWSTPLSDKIRLMLVEKGILPNKKTTYPKDASNRSFSNHYFLKTLPNGESVQRTWLTYSEKIDSVFCFPCKLFVNESSSLGLNGFRDWQHLSRTLSRHETSYDHIKCCNKMVQLQTSLKCGSTVDSLHEKLIDGEKKRWRSVLERIISAVQFLAKQNLAFRGSSSKLFCNDNGNFLQLMEAFSKFDSITAEHIRRIQISENHMPHYLGEKIQNQIITILGNNIKRKIKEMLDIAKYYSIILDCTPDVSHREQITFIVRFVYFNREKISVDIREHFLGFSIIDDTTGRGLCQFLLEFLKNENINIHEMRGQGYDNGANMKGKHNGLQQHILNINPRAFFVPCAAHSLNLVVNDAAKVSNEVVNFFSIVQALYVFFSVSTHRWHIFKSHVTNITLKPLSATRWESRVEALKPLRYFLPDIYDALYELSSDANRDLDSRNEAESLGKKIKSFKFVLSVLIWYDVLTKVNVVSKLLQKTDIHMTDCLKELENLHSYFIEKRSDIEFEKYIDSALNIANDLDLDPVFVENRPLRKRSKKRLFDYEAEDEPIVDSKMNFRVNFYYAILDTTVASINERFTLLKDHTTTFGFLYDFSKLHNFDKETLIKYCEDLKLKLSDDSRGENDISALELCDEILTILPFLENKKKPTEVLEYIFKNDLFDTFPNISIALRILLTLPISVASGERSFSKLKLIKNYLRSSMSQERLNNLAIISIESEICEELNMDEIIKDFVTMKARQVPLL